MSDDQPDLPLPPHGRLPPETVADRMACRTCGDQTLRSMLSQYGARCLQCYDAYCAQAFAFRAPLPPTQAQREWAREMAQREKVRASLGDHQSRAGVGSDAA